MSETSFSSLMRNPYLSSTVRILLDLRRTCALEGLATIHLYECQRQVQAFDLRLLEHLELLQAQLCSHYFLEETISLRKQHALKQTPFVPKSC